jgi:purine-nucleoside phosphorylase
MRKNFIPLYCIALLICSSLYAYDAAFLFAMKEDLNDFSSIQPVASQAIRVGRQEFFPFMNSAGRFIAGTTRGGLLETMEPTVLAYGRLNAKRIVSFGLAGALNDRYRQGDVVIVRTVARHDRGTWTSDEAFLPKSTDAAVLSRDTFVDTLAETFAGKCREAGLAVYEGGRLVSGDAFIAADRYRSVLSGTFAADLVDMNSAAMLMASNIVMIRSRTVYRKSHSIMNVTLQIH